MRFMTRLDVVGSDGNLFNFYVGQVFKFDPFLETYNNWPGVCEKYTLSS